MGLFDRMKQGAYDRVEVNEDGAIRKLTPEEFRAIPLDKRIKGIFGKQFTFYRDGKVVPTSEALRDH
jgi:hypothetical protein